MYIGSVLGATTGNRFVATAPWPGGEWKKACIIFVGGDLSFLKLGLVLVGFNGGVSNL